MKRRTIGQLARETGIGVETVRFYQRRGLLRQPQRPSGGGYRDYDDAAVLTVRYIRLAQTLDLTLREIAEMAGMLGTGARFCGVFRATLARKIAATDAALAALDSRRARLTDAIAACGEHAGGTECPIQSALARMAG